MTRRRLAWIRWSMTLFFALTTTACLLGLAVFTAHQDAAGRVRVDNQLIAQANQIANGLDIDEHGLLFSSAPPGTNLDQALGIRAIGAAPAAVIVQHQIAYASPRMTALPPEATIDRISDAAAHGVAVFTTTSARDGGSARWVAVPIRSAAGAAVILGDYSAPTGEHRTVVLGLTAAVLGLVAVATVAGHVLSGFAMRPAVRSTRQQEQFLREAAHELRTPLATISLLAEAGIRDSDTAVDALRSVHQRLGRMNLLVGSLLARARADAHGTEVERRPLRLDQVVEVTVEELHADERVTVDANPTVVNGNAELLGQAVRNLVENAIRHAPESSVTVTVRHGQLTVEDDGRGAPSTSDTREKPGTRGTGTGLAIVEWVAHVHHATFTLDRSAQGGVSARLRFTPGKNP